MAQRFFADVDQDEVRVMMRPTQTKSSSAGRVLRHPLPRSKKRVVVAETIAPPERHPQRQRATCSPSADLMRMTIPFALSSNVAREEYLLITLVLHH
jgi:hypothetical protein